MVGTVEFEEQNGSKQIRELITQCNELDSIYQQTAASFLVGFVVAHIFGFGSFFNPNAQLLFPLMYPLLLFLSMAFIGFGILRSLKANRKRRDIAKIGFHQTKFSFRAFFKHCYFQIIYQAVNW